jgi:predicted ATP-grasp superfamily ATP-dependent carboligase
VKVDTATPAVVAKLVPELFDYQGLGIARSLGRMGVRVLGCHDSLRAPAAASRYDAEPQVFAGTADEGIEFLQRLGRGLGRAVLIPTDDVSSVAVAERGDELREWFLFPRQPEGLAGTLYSKKELYRLCRRLDVPTPETLFPESREQLEAFARVVRYPVVLKGIDSWLLQQRTGVRMAIVESHDELLREYERLDTPGEPNLMLQEYIPGGPESVWMFNGYFDETSACLFGVTGRKLRQFPAYTGMTSLGVVLRNERVARQTTELMREVGYRGILDIGWRYDARDDRYKLLDVNPRLGATFRLFVATNGMDVVRAAYLDLTGQEVPPSEARDGRKWVVENLDLVSSRRYARDGRLRARGWARSFRGVDEAAWFARDDPKPFALMCARFGAMKARGLATTMRSR